MLRSMRYIVLMNIISGERNKETEGFIIDKQWSRYFEYGL